MLENKSTRRTKKPAAAAKKAAPKVVVETALVGGNGEVSPSQAAQAMGLFDTIPDLVKTLVENIRHNTELLRQIDGLRADQTEDRPAKVEQLRTILNYKAIGEMASRRGDAFQGNLVDVHRVFDKGDFLLLGGLPSGAAKVSVQVDGDETSEVVPLSGNQITLAATAGRDIGRIEVLNSQDEPIRLGPRTRALPSDTSYRSSE